MTSMRYFIPFILLFLAVNAQAGIVKSYSLKADLSCSDNYALLVLSASQLSSLIGNNVDEMSLFHMRSQKNNSTENWQPIIFQIDQKDKQGRFIIQTDNKIPARLSAQDELVIRKKDLGIQLDPDAEIFNQFKLIEVKVINEMSDVMGWFYINTMPGQPLIFNLKKRELSYDKKQDTITTRAFKTGFSHSKPFLINFFYWRLAEDKWSDDLIDMMKIRHSGRFFGLPFHRSQDDYDSVLTAIKEGPLRIIRRTENHIRVFWKLKTPVLYIDYIMMPDGFIMDTMIDIPFKISFFFSELETFTTMDWNPVQPEPLLIFNNRIEEPVPVDGKESAAKQAFNTIEDSRFSVQTFNGTFDVSLDIPDNFPVRALLYLNDYHNEADPPENFPGQYGNVGFRTTGWEAVDSQLYHLKFTVCIQKQQNSMY